MSQLFQKQGKGEQILRHHFLHSLMCWASRISVVAEEGSKNRSTQEKKLWAKTLIGRTVVPEGGANPQCFYFLLILPPPIHWHGHDHGNKLHRTPWWLKPQLPNKWTKTKVGDDRKVLRTLGLTPSTHAWMDLILNITHRYWKQNYWTEHHSFLDWPLGGK